MKIITVLSGKGGTGKSSISASLAISLSRNKKIICADCDVDASNLGLVFGIKENDNQEWLESSTAQRAIFDYDKCDSCRKCASNCYFKAIEFKNNKPVLKEFACEGCGACELVCPQNAIKLFDVANAKIGYAKTRYGFKVVSAQLNIGESGSGKVVAEVKNKAKKIADGADIMLVDSAAGIACPVIASVTGSDYCILVAEPTPSGFFDLERAYSVVKHFGIKSGLIINRFDLNLEYCEKIEQFVRNNKIKILGKLPYDKDFVRALVNMTPVIEISEVQKKLFDGILIKLEQEWK
jgi:MinD superfamily P-loop ATPase